MGSNRFTEYAQSLLGGMKRENCRGRGNWAMKNTEGEVIKLINLIGCYYY